jgi:hypothetical protein
MEPWRPVDVRDLPRRRRSWHPAVVVPLGLVAGFVAVSIVGMWEYANVDHLGILDSPDVVNRASQACATMAEQIAAIPQPLPGDATGEVGAIRAQDQALGRLVTSMEALGQDRLSHDHPAQPWIADWQTLIRLRETYADDLAAGRHPTLVIPTIDGYPITHRMSDPGIDCPIPAQLTAMP